MFIKRFVHPAVRFLQFRHYSMDLKDVVERLDRLAPPSLAEPWDNVGLLLQPYTQRKIKTLLMTNDLSEEVMSEAVEREADFILSYHPPLFQSFKKITTSWKDRIVARSLERGIAIYSPHTAFDTLKGGVNDWLLKPFKVSDVSPVHQKDVSPAHSHQVQVVLMGGGESEALLESLTKELGQQVIVFRDSEKCVKVLCGERVLPSVVNLASKFGGPEPPTVLVTKLDKVPLFEHGGGRKGKLAEQVTIQEAINRIKAHLQLTHLRVALAQGLSLDSQISTIAVCAGSGGSVLRGAGADLWLTGEMSHHDVLDAVHKGTTVILAEHSNSERGFLRELQPTLTELLDGKVKVEVSQKDRDPLQSM